MADIDTSWTWNFTGPTTMSKAHSRAGLPKDVAWDLIGFDGNETGCLRTHPGFRQVTTFVPQAGATFVDAQGVAVLTSATTYVYGLVWFEHSGSTLSVYGKFTTTGTTWLNPNSGTNTNGFITSFSSVSLSGVEVDVQVMGRYLLIFVRGQKPKLVLITLSTVSGPWTATSVDAGPGEAPKIAVTATAPTGSRLGAGNDVAIAVSSSGTGAHVPSGNYSIAVQYMSTETGRKSALSNTVTIEAGAANNHISYTIFRLTTAYNRLLIYRSVNQGGNSGASVYGAGALHLDQVVDISSLTGAAGAGSTTTVSNSSTDEQLVYQDVYVDKGKCDTYMPKGGVAGFMGNTLFVSRISDSTSALPSGISGVTPESPPRGLGDMRWSNTGEMQPENFNPSNRWVPKTPANEILNMRQVGLYLMGFSSDRIYRIGRSGQFIRVEEGHIGYGLQARQGIESIGSMVYFISGGGLKAISSEGQVEDVTALDNLINVTWAGQRSSIQLGFDAYGQCLTVMQPSTSATAASGRAAILWFGTNRVTELVDLPFLHVRAGYHLASGNLQRRAWFIKKVSSAAYGVYVVDHERTIQDDGDPYTAHNLCGGTYLSGGAGDPALYWFLDGTSTNRPAICESAYGCAAYNVATGERTSVQGLWDEWATNPTAFENQTWSIAPIVQRWVGGNVGMQIQPGEPEFKDFFRQKQISSCRSYYETILVPEPDDGTGTFDLFPTMVTPTWDAVVYRGMESEAYSSAKPLNHNGTNMSSFEVQNTNKPGQIANAPFGKHGVLWSSLSPGWTCYLSGVDLRLLAFSAVGRILDSDRRYV